MAAHEQMVVDTPWFHSVSGGLGRLRTLASQGFLAVAGQACVSAANFLTVIVIGRVCGREELGLYALGFSLVVFVSEVQMAVIATPYMVYGPRLSAVARAQYTGSTLLQQLGLCALAVSGLLIAAGAFSLGIGPAGIAPVMWTLSAVLAFIMLREFVRRLCLANLRMATAFAFDVVVSSLQLAAVLLLAHWGKLSASRALCVIGLACGLAALTWLASNRKLFRVRRDRAVEHLRQNWGLAKWVAATAVLWSLSMNFYPWIITAFKGTAETGAFAACFGVVSAGTMLLLGVQNYLGPKIATVYAQSGADAMHRFVVRISLALCLPLIPFCVALGWFGDPLLQWIYGAQYAGNGAIITILSLNLLALALAFSFSRALFAVERADIDFKVNCAAFLVLLTFGIWMVRAHGAWGAAWGLLAANTVAGAFRYGAFVHVIRSQREARAI